jgi:hypothetical protein
MNHRLKEVQELAQEAISLAKESSKETKELKDKMEKQGEKVEKRLEQAETDIYEEMSMREEKRKNVVVHGLAEPNGEDGWARMEEDRKKLNKIFTVLDINVAVETDVEFCRRIGEKSDRARPLVVGFYNEWAKNTLLRNCRYLAGTDMSMISVVQDLTERQRKTEKEMMVEVERRNQEELTEQDKSKNLCWKLVGRRGQKRMVKVAEREAVSRRGGAAGRGAGRGRGAAAPRLTGANLLPVIEPAGEWRPSAGRGGGQRGGGPSSKRKRSGEEEQGRKRGAGRPNTRRAAEVSQESSEEEEEMEMEGQAESSSRPPNQRSSRTAEQQSSQQEQSSQQDQQSSQQANQRTDRPSTQQEVRSGERGAGVEGDLEGIRLGRV